LEAFSLKDFFDNAWRQIREFFKNLEKKQRIRIVVFAVIIVALAITLSVIMSRTRYALLYAGLSDEEASRVYMTLKDMGVDVRTQSAGALFVPENRVSELRMTLSAAGYQSSGLDYSILAEASGFSKSDFEQQEYAILQKQEMLRTTINRSDKVADSVVLIVPAKESDFIRPDEERAASATVMLTTKNGETFSQTEVDAIVAIVVNAVAGLAPESVSIVDEALNVYLPTDPDGEEETANITTQRLLEESMKRELTSQVVNLLTPVFGAGKVRANVSVALNFDSEESETLEFGAPIDGSDEGLAISIREEIERAREAGAAGGVPGTDNNGMGTQEDVDGTIEYPYGELAEDETYSKAAREANYEINKKTTLIKKAQGTIKSLSIGVLVDSVAVPEDYTEQVRRLVASAIGTSEDYVTVERMPFQDVESNPVSEGIAAVTDAIDRYKFQELIKTGIICATALILIIMTLALLRSLFKKPAPPPEPVLAEGGVDYLIDDDGEYASGPYGEEAGLPEEEEDVTVGAPPPEAVVQLEKMIKSNPEAVASILRGWLLEE
jgi:flagellar M-ring protein FliF